MSPIDYMERETNQTFQALMRDYNYSYERTHKAVTLLMAGASTAGAYVLAQFASDTSLIPWLPIAALSLWWYAVAIWLILKASFSNELSSGATYGLLDARYKLYGGRSIREDPSNESALHETRTDNLDATERAIAKYRKAMDRRMSAIDRAYVAIACSPVVALLAVATRYLL